MARRLWAKQHLANRQLAKQLNKGIMYQSTANQNLFSQHFIFFVTYEWALQARAFVTGKPIVM